MFKKIKIMFRRAQSLYMNLMWGGIGKCGSCYRNYYSVQEHTTVVKKNYAIYPLCQDCWFDMTIEERLPYYESWTTHVTKKLKQQIMRAAKQGK